MSYEIVLLCIWVMSIATATFLGVDRGRWMEGVALGVLLGPLGALAAGMMTPSYDWEARRKYQLSEEIARQRQVAAEYARQREEEVRRMRELVNSLAQNIANQPVEPAAEFEEIADSLQLLAREIPQAEKRLQPSINWLMERARKLRDQSLVS